MAVIDRRSNLSGSPLSVRVCDHGPRGSERRRHTALKRQTPTRSAMAHGAASRIKTCYVTGMVST